jgi:hypothetical protein
MHRVIYSSLALVLAAGIAASSGGAQSDSKSTPTGASSAQKGIELVQQGHCREALPILKRAGPQTADKQLKLKAGLATVRCGLLLNQTDTAVTTLLWLN